MLKALEKRLYDRTIIEKRGYLYNNKALFALLVPIIVEQLLNSFMGMVDTMMVSNVGSEAISAVSLVDAVNNLVIQVFAAMAAGTYLLALVGFSCVTLLGRCYTGDLWSEVTTKYYIFAPNDTMSLVATLTTGRLYNNLPPWSAALHICGLMFLFLLLISLLLLVGFVCKMRVGGIILTVGLLCLGNVLAYMENNIRWLFPTAHAIMEIHFDEIYKKPIMDMRFSYIYYLLLIVVCVMISYVAIDHYDFSRIQEMEE